MRELRNQGHKVGLRTVAIVEASKGVAVLTLCLLLLSLLHRDLSTVVDRLTDILRLSPDSRLADWCYRLADRTTGRGIWIAATVGGVYATGRFLEAYGLWNQRAWGEWLSVVSGAIYLPFELYAVFRHPHWTNFLLLAGNLLVVLYIIGILMENRRCRHARRDASRSDVPSSDVQSHAACEPPDSSGARPRSAEANLSRGGGPDSRTSHPRPADMGKSNPVAEE